MADNQHSCEIAPGIFLIKVPLPENPLKQLNSYLILDEDRPALVDVGFNRIECEQVLRRALDDLASISKTSMCLRHTATPITWATSIAFGVRVCAYTPICIHSKSRAS